jgi:uncharacterized protein YhaN
VRGQQQRCHDELAAIKSQLGDLQTLAQLQPNPKQSLAQQLDELKGALQACEAVHQRREGLRRTWESLRSDQKGLAEQAKTLEKTRRRLLQRCGVTGVADFGSALRRTTRAAQLRKRRDKLLRQIARNLGPDVSDQQVRVLLDKEADEEFGERLQALVGTYEERKNQFKSLHQRLGEIKHQAESLADRKESDQQQLELSMIEARIEDALARWRVLASTSLVLDAVRQSYETDRQPEALAEASGYMERLSGGCYTRIWTPFGQTALCVEDRDKQSLPVEKLSRGTREQVFLALRLALVRSFGRRGASLPMVLDDVLVNFDVSRARAAAQVVCDFARAGQQILVFTCHEHIRELFTQLGADVRQLASESRAMATRRRRPGPGRLPAAATKKRAVVVSKPSTPAGAPHPLRTIADVDTTGGDAGNRTEMVREVAHRQIAIAGHREVSVANHPTDERQVLVVAQAIPVTQVDWEHARSREHESRSGEVRPHVGEDLDQLLYGPDPD